jgi:hypothetical protein
VRSEEEISKQTPWIEHYKLEKFQQSADQVYKDEQWVSTVSTGNGVTCSHLLMGQVIIGELSEH